MVGRAVLGWEGKPGRNSHLPSLPMPHCPSHRHRLAKDGTSEDSVNVPRKSGATGAAAAKSQAVPWQGRDRAPQPSYTAGKPSQKDEAPCPQLPCASVPAQAPIWIPRSSIPVRALGKASATALVKTGESPKPNTAESIQPHNLMSHLPRDEQSSSTEGGSANKRQLTQIYQSLSRTITGFSALKITEEKGSHFITFDRTGSWSHQISAGEQSRHHTPQPSLVPLRCEAEAKWGQG